MSEGTNLLPGTQDHVNACYISSWVCTLQDGKLYGDGWTPLMAAAVADRHGIALRLLAAAGTAVDRLVRHANRYGQTAVHIAARKGSLPMLKALLTVGGPAVAVVSFSTRMSCWSILHTAAAVRSVGGGVSVSDTVHVCTSPGVHVARSSFYCNCTGV